VGPIIKVAEHNSRPRNIHRPEKVAVYKPNGLLPSLAMRRAEMHVKHMHQMMADADVRAKHTSLLVAMDCQIDLSDEFKFPSAECYVSVYTAPVFSGLSNREEVT
jgi:hypothetical protein